MPGTPTIASSLGCPFLIVSSNQLVKSMKSSSDPFLVDAEAKGIVSSWESTNAFVLADFEGEMPGFGGDLCVAQFLVTTVINAASLKSCLENKLSYPPGAKGLLIDMHDRSGIQIVKRIMESNQITKLIWGADGDLISLRYPLQGPSIRSVNAIDVQLGYSSPGRRLGMARMLSNLPNSMTAKLPGKQGIFDFSPQARNQRILRVTMSTNEALYAADELHRIEAILRYQSPYYGGSFSSAKSQTDEFILNIEYPSFAVKRIQDEMVFAARKYGEERKIKSANMARACRHVEMIFRETGLTESQRHYLSTTKARLEFEIGIFIPDDLSFADH